MNILIIKGTKGTGMSTAALYLAWTMRRILKARRQPPTSDPGLHREGEAQ